MEPCRDGEVSRPRSGGLPSRKSTETIFSLNEAWLHTLDEVRRRHATQPNYPSVDAQLLFRRRDLRGLVAAEGPRRSRRCRYRRLHRRKAGVVIPTVCQHTT